MIPISDISWHEPMAPEYELGQTVYYIQYDDNRPAAMSGKRWGETVVLSYVVYILNDDKGSVKALCKGYKLNVYKWPGDSDWYARNEVYGSQEEVEKLCRWFPVEGITDDEWMNLLGDREINSTERAKAKTKFNKQWDHDWIRHTEAEPIPIEDSELGFCCSCLSNARDILIQCCRHNGLIYRDVQRFYQSMIGGNHGNMLEPHEDLPVLGKVLEQLKEE
jgi:hypothetical protein